METLGGKVGRLLLALVFVVAGVMKLAAVEFEVQAFAHFGYAPWFMYLIGVLELAGGLMMLIRSRAAAVGAVLLLPIMLGAAWSHVAAGDGIALAAPALLLLGLLAGFAWIRRADLPLPPSAGALPAA